MFWICWIIITALCVVIAYQDFKERMISVWPIAAFAIVNLAQYVTIHSLNQLGQNFIFCILYFLLLYLSIHLYGYIKTKRFERVMDSKIGWGDWWVALFVGCCIEPAWLVLFFTATLLVGVFIQLLFIGRRKTVPLAGFLAVAYVLFSLLRFTSIL